MADDKRYQELKAKYDALQLRLTRFSAVEQKLIDTGYRLDRELSRFGAIYGYSKRLIGIEGLNEFAEIAAEAVVDVFEVEIGALWLLDSAGDLPSLPSAVAGSNESGLDWPALGAWLREQGFPAAAGPLAELISREDAVQQSLPGLARIVACPLLNSSGTPNGIVLGMVTEQSRLFYDATTAEYAGSFNVFAQLVGTLLQNRADQEIIQQQIDALRQSEAKLVSARDAAEAASRAKSTFLANMSHEIRTPMNGVLGMTELLISSRRLEGRQHRLAEMAHRSAKSLLGVINDILDFSKIEAGRMQLSAEDFDLGRLLEECLDLVTDQAQRKGLALIADFPADPHHAVHGDPVRLRQVLVNLLGNAVKFTEQGVVRLGAEILSQDATGLSLQFEIEDTGPGIPPGQGKKIFNAFEQADGSSTRRHGGTGLGLAISRQLVTLMDGAIDFTSTPDHGTCFRVLLTLKQAMHTLEEPAESETHAGSSPGALQARVLLVEDNPVNQEVALGMLEYLGCRVDVASDGQEAVDLLARNDYGLVLMDCHMPGVDGFAAAREARRLEREQGRAPVPIIALTADVEKGIEQRCRVVGMDGYLSKPFELAQLQSALKQWLQG